MDGEAQNALVGALGVLNEREKLTIIGLFVRGDSFRTLAAKMACSPRTITRLKASSLKKMALALQDEAESLLNPAVTESKKIPGPSTISPVPWNRCRRCDAVAPTEEDYCERCGPVAAATAMAYMR